MNLDLDLKVTLIKDALCTWSHCTLLLCRVISKCHQPSMSYRQTFNTVIQCLTLNNDLGIESNLVEHTHCTSTHHTWHLCRAICKFHQGFNIYREDTIVCLTLTLTLKWPSSNIHTAYWLIILDICAELFVYPTRGSKDIERAQNTVIQCLSLNYDLDLEHNLVKHIWGLFLLNILLFKYKTNYGKALSVVSWMKLKWRFHLHLL